MVTIEYSIYVRYSSILNFFELPPKFLTCWFPITIHRERPALSKRLRGIHSWLGNYCFVL